MRTASDMDFHLSPPAFPTFKIFSRTKKQKSIRITLQISHKCRIWWKFNYSQQRLICCWGASLCTSSWNPPCINHTNPKNIKKMFTKKLIKRKREIEKPKIKKRRDTPYMNTKKALAGLFGLFGSLAGFPFFTGFLLAAPFFTASLFHFPKHKKY